MRRLMPGILTLVLLLPTCGGPFDPTDRRAVAARRVAGLQGRGRRLRETMRSACRTQGVLGFS
jgi:hypothetical protein